MCAPPSLALSLVSLGHNDLGTPISLLADPRLPDDRVVPLVHVEHVPAALVVELEENVVLQPLAQLLLPARALVHLAQVQQLRARPHARDRLAALRVRVRRRVPDQKQSNIKKELKQQSVIVGKQNFVREILRA